MATADLGVRVGIGVGVGVGIGTGVGVGTAKEADAVTGVETEVRISIFGVEVGGIGLRSSEVT
jgi:hypothetical protein